MDMLSHLARTIARTGTYWCRTTDKQLCRAWQVSEASSAPRVLRGVQRAVHVQRVDDGAEVFGAGAACCRGPLPYGFMS